MDNNKKLERFSKGAITNYRKSDEARWVSAFFCFNVAQVGKYVPFATINLAGDMSVSPDTVENMAHAYSLYRELGTDQTSTLFVRVARKLPYIYQSHFRALYDARERFGLTIDQVFSLLLDIVMAEGSISSRDIDAHVRKRFGKEYTWQYYAQKAQKELNKLVSQPDFPKNRRKSIKSLIDWIGKNA